MKTQRTPHSSARARSGALAVAWIGMIFAGLGCTPEIRKSGDYQTGLEVEDLPVYPGFELAKSEVYRPPIEDEGFRSSVSYYHGQGSIGEIVPFYVETMPGFGWKFQESIYKSDDESRLLRFYKEDTVAWIRVYRGYNPVRGGYATVVEARISPRRLESFDLEEYFGISRKTAPAEPKSESSREPSMPGDPNRAPSSSENTAPRMTPDAYDIEPASAPLDGDASPAVPGPGE
ncbi:MAG: hypothetical protein JXA90_14945 [Planctomycetes bacterium]|nr:hypothetical protein [Planctomycetota bacterium]